MKKTILGLVLIMTALYSNAQNCMKATSAVFTNPSNDNVTWYLNLSWTADGQKHLEITVTDGLTNYPVECLQSNGVGNSNGTITYGPYNTLGGHATLGAVIKSYTGTCNGGAYCGLTQIIPQGGSLAVKFGQINAKSFGNTTEITFQAESTDAVNNLSFNFKMPNGTLKQYHIVILDKLNIADVWVVTLNNLTGSYTVKKK